MTSDHPNHEGIYINGVPLDDHLNRTDPDDPLPRTPRRTCPRGKARYESERAATEALRRVIDRNATERSYLPGKVWGPCRSCDGWHMTAKEGKPWKHGKRRR